MKETPFKVAKSSRQRSQSRSPMVSSTKPKGTSVGRTPKARLRHENSQMQFEPIVSSPSNLNNQESQVLTERQREVYERQTRSSNLYADIRSASPLLGPITQVRSPLEFHSDVLNADDLPIEPSRTPLRSVRALGPMDVFVGSSPTPQARTRSQELTSGRTNVATPTTVRTFELARGEDDPGSSPPRFDKDTNSSIREPGINGRRDDSRDNLHEGDEFGRHSMSFDDGPTMDEDDFLTGTPDEDPEAERTTETEAFDMPSSTLDLQLTAQLAADIDARKIATTGKGKRQSMDLVDQNQHEPSAENDTGGDDTGIDLPLVTSVRSSTATTSTSRVGDSFTSQAVETESSQVASLRRSTRNSSAPSPQSVNTKKRKSSSARGPGRPKKTKSGESSDMAGVTTPRPDNVSKSKSPSPSPIHTGSTIIVPDTTRARSLRRSASSLSQADANSVEVTAQDTPAPKRARRSVDKDVSEAKHNTPMASQQLKKQRLRHVQATPKHLDANSPAVAVGEAIVPHGPNGPELAVGEQTIEVAPQVLDATPATSPRRESQSQGVSNSVATPSRSFAERVFLTPRSIIDKLREFKDALFGVPQLALNRQEEREADDLMFEIRRAVHAAGARGGQTDQ